MSASCSVSNLKSLLHKIAMYAAAIERLHNHRVSAARHVMLGPFKTAIMTVITCATAVVNAITVQQELLQIGISCFEYAQGLSEHCAVNVHAISPALCKPGGPLRRCYKCTQTCMVRVLTCYSACRLKREKVGKAESKEEATRWWC